jgi:hypothetical protein
LYNNYNLNTAKIHLIRIKSFYKHNKIKIGDLGYISEKGVFKTPPLRFKQLPTKKILSKAIEMSSPLMNSIIFFMSSSGCARAETLNLTIQDFINSLSDYTTETKIDYIISDVINQKKVVPTFEILRQKTNVYYETFCSPEAVDSILNYLLIRKEILNPDKKLFKVCVFNFTKMFTDLNNALELGQINGKGKFTSHMLRKYHASRLAMSFTDEKKGIEISGMNRDDINSLQGRIKGGTDNSYFFDDFEGIKKQYIQALPKLTIYDENSILERSAEYKKLKNNIYEVKKENKFYKDEFDKLESTIEKARKFAQLYDELNPSQIKGD